jgi:hypothetical protein
MERREAQRPTSLAARIPQAAPPGNRDAPWMRLAGRKVRPAGLVSLLPVGGDPPWRLPALHSLFREGRKIRDTGHPGRPKTKPPGGGALA